MSDRLRAFVLLLFLGAASAPAWAQPHYRSRPYYGPEHSLRLRAGAFQPQGDSDYWETNAAVFTGDADDFEDVSFGLDYRLDVTEHFGVLFSGSFFQGTSDLAYRDFEDEFGDDILHTTTLDVAAFTVGGVVHFTNPGAAVRPYVGAGGGLYTWRLEESGDFIVFEPPPAEIFDGTFEDEGQAFGYYLLAGLEVPLGDAVGLFAEGRWTGAEAELDDDFEGLGDLDLGGREISAGVSFRF